MINTCQDFAKVERRSASGPAHGRNAGTAAPLPDGRALAGGAVRTGPATPIGGYHQLTASTEIFT